MSSKFRQLNFILAALIIIWLPSCSFVQTKDEANQKIETYNIPLIGCSVDVQGSLVPAQKNAEKTLQLKAKVAGRVAYYQLAQGELGVLAPRGWHCFGTEGSAAHTIFVTPDPTIKADDLYASSWKGFAGPVVIVGEAWGDTSGRFDVAELIAHLFPAYKRFVKEVISEGFPTARDFPTGPYPKDKMTYRNDRIAEYQTPPHSKGLGTAEGLKEDNNPINGAVILNKNFDADWTAVRLPPDIADLKSDIIRQFEQERAADQ